MPSIDEIINRQFRQWEMQKREREEAPPVRQPPVEIVTVSREHGSRGAHFASLLADRLQYQLIHKEIVEAICASTGYRKRIISSLDEQYRSRLELMVDSIFSGQAVDHSDYFKNLAEVVLSMARLGGVVLVGRAGNFILGANRGFHVRFVCPRQIRIQNLIKYRNLTHEDAVAGLERSDRERRSLIRKVFDADINDPHHYDLVLNSGYIDIERWVEPTIAAIKIKFARLAGAGDSTP